jgi:hypothetical protein
LPLLPFRDTNPDLPPQFFNPNESSIANEPFRLGFSTNRVENRCHGWPRPSSE